MSHFKIRPKIWLCVSLIDIIIVTIRFKYTLIGIFFLLKYLKNDLFILGFKISVVFK